MARILCAWSPIWAIANWRRRNPSDSPASPFALVETVRGVRRLGCVDFAAARLRLYPGQKATDAFALVPDLATAEAEPQADAAALEALVDWCVRYSPAVAADPPDGLFLDITGLAHLWGGEAALMDDFATRLAANGLPFRCAIADTPAAAWALAHFGPDQALAAPGAQAEALGPLPPAALRLDEAAAQQIERLGFRRLAQLFALPRAPLARRFGAAVLDRIDQALGRSGEALAFRRPPTPWIARLAFPEPISAPPDMARVGADLAQRLCARLERDGKGARRFELFFHRLDGASPSVGVGLAFPGREAGRIAKLLQSKIETIDPGFGVEAATLTAAEVETLAARQSRLDNVADHGIEEGISPLIDRLANRLGEDRVWRAAPAESHVPELSQVRVRPLTARTKARPWNPETPRPIRLFRRPEPLEAVIALTPDDPPTQFRWRGRLHRVRRADGPERIAEEWWKRDIDEISATHVRDYYRVEDTEGARFWLFRAGLYAPGAAAKWWLHGLFG